MSAHTPPPLRPWQLWLRWTLAYAAGWALSQLLVAGDFGGPLVFVLIGLLLLVGQLVPTGYDHHVLMAELGFIEGTVIGLCLWLALRGSLRSARSWVPLTALGWALGWAAGEAIGRAAVDYFLTKKYATLPSWELGRVSFSIVFACCVGGCQWLALRRDLRQAARWAAATTLSWAAAWHVGWKIIRANELAVDWNYGPGSDRNVLDHWMLAMGCIGAIGGALSGLALLALLTLGRRQAYDPVELAAPPDVDQRRDNRNIAR